MIRDDAYNVDPVIGRIPGVQGEIRPLRACSDEWPTVLFNRNMSAAIHIKLYGILMIVVILLSITIKNGYDRQ